MQGFPLPPSPAWRTGNIVETYRKNASRSTYVNRLMKETRHFARVQGVEICVEVVEALGEKGFPNTGMNLAKYMGRDFACAVCQK